jgi:beta-glucosidase
MTLGNSTITAQESFNVSVEVRNTGNRDGQEVVQVYARPGESQAGPQQRLIGFKRLALGAGKSERVTISIPGETLRTWDSSTKRYAIRPGRYRIEVGGSSSDIRGGETLTIR